MGIISCQGFYGKCTHMYTHAHLETHVCAHAPSYDQARVCMNAHGHMPGNTDVHTVYTLAQAHAVISREAQRGDRVTPLQDSCQQVPRSPPDKAGARSGHTGVGVRDWVPGPPALTVGNPRCEGGVPVADQSP